MLVEIVKLVDQ